jgi:hypothetical protein
MHYRDHADAHHAFPDGAAVAQVDRKAEKNNQVDDAVPVLEEVQFYMDVLIVLPQAGLAVGYFEKQNQEAQKQRAGDHEIDQKGQRSRLKRS